MTPPAADFHDARTSPGATPPQRIALGIEYDGSAFHGWQWQPGRRTIQQTLEEAIGRVADEPVSLVTAGRTDAGVHALEQVAHFDSRARRSVRSWVLGANTHLPPEIRVLWARPLPAGFHARYSAIARCYRYRILNRPVHSALQRRRVTWVYRPLDADAMQRAAVHLVGEHDFSSFRAQDCQSRTPWRQVHFLDVVRQEDEILIDVAANAFLHHMVRNLVGVLLEIGLGRQPPEWAAEVLRARRREAAAVTAPADGLYLRAVCYPLEFGLERHAVFDRLPADAARHRETPEEHA